MNVQIYDANEKPFVVPWFQLLQWKHAISLELKGLKHSRGSVSAHVKRRLGYPRNAKREDIYNMLEFYVAELKAQMEES